MVWLLWLISIPLDTSWLNLISSSCSCNSFIILSNSILSGESAGNFSISLIVSFIMFCILVIFSSEGLVDTSSIRFVIVSIFDSTNSLISFITCFSLIIFIWFWISVIILVILSLSAPLGNSLSFSNISFNLFWRSSICSLVGLSPRLFIKSFSSSISFSISSLTWSFLRLFLISFNWFSRLFILLVNSVLSCPSTNCDIFSFAESIASCATCTVSFDGLFLASFTFVSALLTASCASFNFWASGSDSSFSVTLDPSLMNSLLTKSLSLPALSIAFAYNIYSPSAKLSILNVVVHSPSFSLYWCSFIPDKLSVPGNIII